MGLEAGYRLGLHRPARSPVNIFVDDREWALRTLGSYIRDSINAQTPDRVALVDVNRAGALFDGVLHFTSRHQWQKFGNYKFTLTTPSPV